MTSRSSFCAIALALGLIAAAPAARAQGSDPRPERERREAAREEQRREREAREREASEAARAAEEAREQERLADLDAAGVTPLFEDAEGFFIRLEAWSSEVSGADRTVAHAADIVTSATTAEELDQHCENPGQPDEAYCGLPDAFSLANVRPLTLTYDSEVSPRIELGWRFGDGATVSIRYWAYSSSADLTAASSLQFDSSAGGAPLILGGIDNAGIENEFGEFEANPDAFRRAFGSPSPVVDNRLHGADSIVASGDLDVSRWDLLYGRTALVRPRFVLSYVAGLTAASVERSETATLTWRSFEQGQVAIGANLVETIRASSDASAFGATAGISGRYRLGHEARWSLRFGVEVSGLKSSQDLSFRNSSVLSLDPLPEPVETVYQDVTRDGSSQLLTIVEGDVAVEGRVGERVRLALGYRHGTWLDAVGQQRFPDPDNPALLAEEQVDVDVGGPYFRVGFYF